MQPVGPERVFSEPRPEQQGTICLWASTQHQRLGSGVCQMKVHIKRVGSKGSDRIDGHGFRSVPCVGIRAVLKEIRQVIVHLSKEESEAVGCRISGKLQGGATPGGCAARAERGMGEAEEGGGGEVEGDEVAAEIGGEEEKGTGRGEKVRIIKTGQGAEREAKGPAGGRGVEAEEGGVARGAAGEEEEPGGGGEGGIEVVEAAEVGRRDNSGEGTGDGAQAVEVGKGQSEENLVEELGREEEKAQRGGTSGRGWSWGRRVHAFCEFRLNYLSPILGSTV